MGFTEDLALEVVKKALDYGGVLFNKKACSTFDLEDKLKNHLTYINNWSSRIQLFDMADPKTVNDHSVCVELNSTPRFFSYAGQIPDRVDENTILNDKENYIVLGDPGSGKTTYLKRLCQKLLSTPTGKDDIYQYPILIELRKIAKPSHGVIGELARILGLNYTALREAGEKKSWEDERASRGRARLIFDEEPLEIPIANFLNDTKAFLMIDGLDEIPTSMRRAYEEELSSIAYSLSSAKIISTCRSGGYANQIEGFSILEILPLSAEQQKQIVDFWVEDVEGFLAATQNVSYKMMFDRPLFLTQIITLFNNLKRLPDRSVDVCENLIRLAIFKWDSSRRISRKSQYAYFSTEEKLEFLMRVAYELLFVTETKYFTEAHLAGVYERIHKDFGLPKNDCLSVVKEIESHNGILVQTSFENYEFCHLTFQEFLAAKYIMGEPALLVTQKYFDISPETLAVAISLSPNSSSWLSSIIMNDFDYTNTRIHFGSVAGPIVKRLIIEKPRFQVDSLCGYSILRLLSGDVEFQDMKDFAELRNVKESVESFIKQNGFILKESLVNEKEITLGWLGGFPRNMKFKDRDFFDVRWEVLRYFMHIIDVKIVVVDNSNFDEVYDLKRIEQMRIELKVANIQNN